MDFTASDVNTEQLRKTQVTLTNVIAWNAIRHI